MIHPGLYKQPLLFCCKSILIHPLWGVNWMDSGNPTGADHWWRDVSNGWTCTRGINGEPALGIWSFKKRQLGGESAHSILFVHQRCTSPKMEFLPWLAVNDPNSEWSLDLMLTDSCAHPVPGIREPPPQVRSVAVAPSSSPQWKKISTDAGGGGDEFIVQFEAGRSSQPACWSPASFMQEVKDPIGKAGCWNLETLMSHDDSMSLDVLQAVMVSKAPKFFGLRSSRQLWEKSFLRTSQGHLQAPVYSYWSVRWWFLFWIGTINNMDH